MRSLRNPPASAVGSVNVRAVASDRAARPRSLQVVPRTRALRRALWIRFADDRELVGLKLLLLAGLTLLAMALELHL